MASFHDKVPFTFYSAKLPAVANDVRPWRNREETWAQALRVEIDHAIHTTGRPNKEDIIRLHKKIVKLIVVALQPNSPKQAWLDLTSALELIEPYANFLSIGHGQALQTQHYIERLFITFQRDNVQESDIPLLYCLEKVFPKEFAIVESKYKGISLENSFWRAKPSEEKRRTSSRQKLVKGKHIPHMQPDAMVLPDGRNPYSPLKSESRNIEPRPLTFGDLRQSLSVVAIETSAQESVWKGSHGSADAPTLQRYTSDSRISYVPSPAVHWKEEVEEEYSKPIQSIKKNLLALEDFKAITGREAVELFTTKKHLNIIQFMYFNLAKGRYYRPYDLVSVPQDKADPEHFIFSTFGVLHVYPDGSTSETMSLSEWNRMAVLWGVVSKISFFRNFLVSKSLRHWRYTIRRQRLMRTRSFLEKHLVHAVPEFGLALIHIMRLVTELCEFRLLPNESCRIRDLPLAGFLIRISKRENEIDKMLEAFFSLCKKVVDATRQECFDQLKHCEYQAQYQKSVFNKESLYIQRRKKLARRMNLEKAQQAVKQLSTFMSLAHQIISVHLLQAVRTSVLGYVYGVLCPEDGMGDQSTPTNEGNSLSANLSKGYPSTRSAKEDSSKHSEEMKSEKSVFVAKLEFHSKNHGLVMQPSPEKFRTAVCSCIPNMLSILCEKGTSAKKQEKSSGKEQEKASASHSFDDSKSIRSDHSPSTRSSLDLGKNINFDHLGQEVTDESSVDVSGMNEVDMEKDQDVFRLVTPNLVTSPEPGQGFGLMVTGEAVFGHYNPLDQSNLRNQLNSDNEILEAVEFQNTTVDSALQEVEQFCSEHNEWLIPIRQFTAHWSRDSLKNWKGKPAREIENMLNQIKAWSDKIKNMDRILLCSNRLLLVDCRTPLAELVATLSSIFKQLVSLITGDAKELSSDVTNNSRDAIKLLETKDLSIKSFAAYARKVVECQQMKGVMSQKVGYIRELYEVVRMTYRQLTHDEEKLEEKVKTAWEAFVFQLKDASNFVSNQQPLILKQLDEIFKQKYAYAKDLGEIASSGEMTNPTRQPSEVISQLVSINAKFTSTRRQLLELSSCREAIEGKKFDMEDLSAMSKVMEARLELWKSVNISFQAMNEWRNTLFRRFNVQAAIDKVLEWQRTSEKFQQALGASDAVLQNWLKLLSDYQTELPLLQRMGDQAMKTRHWKEIFTGLGQNFEAGWTFTVKDLLSYNLSQHTNLINQVCHGAIAEHTLEQMLRAIKEKWETKQFHLAKHIHVVRTEQKEHPAAKSDIERARKGFRRRENKITSLLPPKIVMQEVDSETYVLVESEKLIAELSDSQVTLQSMLQSRHAAEVQVEAEIWSNTFKQIAEIIDLWISCQDKWMYLNLVCHNGFNLTLRFPEQALLFEDMDRRYREFIKAVLNDPNVLSVLSRRHGQKGWRELQGENLRKHLYSCLRMQEELLSAISHLLEEFRSEFPRMYFLSDEDCVCFLAISRKPKALAPYVLKCFDGIKFLTYDLPMDGLASGAALDQELNSHKLQVTKVHGKNGEALEFSTPLTMQSDAISWMKLLESKLTESLKNSLVKLICDHNARSRLNLTDEMDEVGENISKSEHWMVKFPTQIIILHCSICWSKDVYDALSSSDHKKLQRMLAGCSNKIEQYSQILRECSKTTDKHVYEKVYSTASVLVAQLLYHRDVSLTLNQSSVPPATSFEWQRIIKHRMEIPSEELDFAMKSMRPNEIDCFVEHMGKRIAEYGMEYDSSFLDGENDSHLGMPFIMSPLSDRLVFALCITYQLGKCGTLIGPEGTGKSVLVRQLAKVFGRPLTNINCSEEFEIPVLLRALCGMIESAGFLCFDQVQLLPVNTLSSLVQHVRNFQLAFGMFSNTTQSQYKQRGSKMHNRQGMKRSNSIPSMHSVGVENETASKTSKWTPKVDESQLSRINQNREEMMFSYPSKANSGGLGSILFSGRLLRAQSRFGLFMTLNCSKSAMPEIPQSMKLIYRPVLFIEPQMEKIAEVWLTVNGFSNSVILASKIVLSAKIAVGISESTSSENDDAMCKSATVTLNDVRSMVALSVNAMASKQLNSSSRRNSNKSEFESTNGSLTRTRNDVEAMMSLHFEEVSLGPAVLKVLSQKFHSEEALRMLKDSLQRLFPHLEKRSSKSEDSLMLSVHHHLLMSGLRTSPKTIAKINELNSALEQNKAALLAGPAGCGKTTIYKTLAQVLNTMTAGGGLKKGFESPRREQAYLGKKEDSAQIPTENGSSTHSQEDGKSIDMSILYPNVLSPEDLFGFFKNSASGAWRQGTLSKIFRNRHDGACTRKEDQKTEHVAQHVSKLSKWIVLDGEVTAPWIENINSLLDINRSSRLPNLDKIEVPDETKIIFEATDLSNVSPALISRCNIVHCGEPNLWNYVLSSWMDAAYGKYAITRKIILVWKDLVEDLFPQTLKFLQRLGRNILDHGTTSEQKHDYSFGISEVTAFIHLLSSLLSLHMDRNTPSRKEQRSSGVRRPTSEQTLVSEQSCDTYTSSVKSQLDDDIPDFHHQLAMNFFGFAFVWACGGKLLADDMSRFDVFFRNLLSEAKHEILFPIYENVFEYFVDAESGQFTVWEDKIDLRPHVPPTGAYYSYIHQIERYSYLSSLLLKSHHPVLIMGKSGCGKSSMVKNILQEEHEMMSVPISSGMTPWHLQKLIESRSSPHLKQHNIGLMAHPNAVIDTRSEKRQKALFFLDDLSSAPNIPDSAKSQCMLQPVHELIRQVLCIGGLYDREHLMIKSLEGEVNFLAATTIPGAVGSGLGYSTHLISPRLVRLFFVIHFLEPSKEAILSIYHSIVQSWLEEFPAYALSRHYELSQAIIAGAVEVYSSVRSQFKPTPRKPTYLFSLHDVSHVMKGLFLLTPPARGRPRPVRRRPLMPNVKEDGGAAVNMRRQRPLAGRAGRRFRTKEWGDPSFGAASPMMKTVIRLWLHECSRTFHDRLTSESDRRWFSDFLVSMLKKHFCTSAHEERPATPGINRSSLEDKTPRPSARSTSDSSHSATTSSSAVVDNSTSETADSENFSKERKPSSATEEDSRPDLQLDSTDSPDFILDDEETLIENITSPSFDGAENKGFSSNDETTSESSVIIDGGFQTNEDFDTQDSSEGTDGIELETSLPATSADLKTDFDDESQSVGTGLTSEVDTVSSSKTEDRPSIVESSLAWEQTNMESSTSVPQPSAGPSLKPRLKRVGHARPGGAKFGVTFVPGLINDPEQNAALAGPLANFDQILSENEDPTSILFCKNILFTLQGGPEEYCEGTEDELAAALDQAQMNYNANSSAKLDLVFFHQAIEHLARLSRVLSMNEGHAVCLSAARFAGRKSLCYLAAYLCKTSLVNGAAQNEETDSRLTKREKLKKLVSDASMSAGIKNESTVLLLDEFFTSDISCLSDLCTLVKNGHYPSLYSQEELVTIATEISSNTSLIGKDSLSKHHHESLTDKLDLCLRSYFKRVISNLHLVLLMRSASFDGAQDLSPLMQDSESSYFHHSCHLKWLHTAFKRCPEILTRFLCIDVFQPWNHQAWMRVSKCYLERSIRTHIVPGSEKSLRIPRSVSISEETQIHNVAHVMSYIHQDAFKRIQATFPKSFDGLITPTSLHTMIKTFVHMAVKLGESERKLFTRYEQVLAKIEEAELELDRYSLGREGLLPLLHAAMDTERSWKRHVEQERREYAEAKERCNFEEDMIEHLDEELVHFRQDAKLAFDEVNPLYNVAMQAMQAMTAQGLDELKRYQKPPDGAKVVAKALCDLFQVKPATWENGKALLMRDNFFEELEFFDKDNVPEHIFQALSKNVKDPEFQPHQVGKSSKAAESLSVWMHAIHSYAKLSRYLAPKVARLKDAEAKLKKAQATLGAKRVRCNQIKEELDLKIQQHKNAYAAVKQYEQDLENLESKITKAQILMGNLAEHVCQWRQKRDIISSRLDSVIGDSLLTAACLTYHTTLSKVQSELSFRKWTEVCLHGHLNKTNGTLEIVLQNSAPSMSLQGHNSLSPSENTDNGHVEIQSCDSPFICIRSKLDPRKLMLPRWIHRDWQKVGLPKNERIRSAVASVVAVATYQQSSWPLIFDPDGVLRIWMKEISRLCYETTKPEGQHNADKEGMKITQEANASLVVKSNNSTNNGSWERKSIAPDEKLPGNGVRVSHEEAQNAKVLETVQSKHIKMVVCEADNSSLSEKLEESIQNGSVVFVTNLERADFPVLHHLILLKNQLLFQHDKADQPPGFAYPFRIDKNFRLFLSTSVALNHFNMNDGIGLFSQSCSCIDFSLDADGLEERLTYLLLSQEKPDFENHHRLLEADIFHLEEQRKDLHTNLLKKVLSIENSILSDPSLLDDVRLCKRETTATNIALSETKMMEANLIQKTSDLRAVGKYGRMLFTAVLQSSSLERQLYYWTASSFLSLFTSALKLTVRGKSSVNASSSPSGSLSLKSRAAELIQSMLDAVLHATKRSMFKDDYFAFATIVSLAKLHHENKMTPDEIQSFISGVSKKKAGSSIKPIALDKPAWMSEKIWEDAKNLQQTHHIFKGIIESLSSKKSLWYEYLYSEPVLQANLPTDSFSHLNIGHKALLWRTLRPDMNDEIVSKLNACVLGSVGTEPYQWSIREFLEKTKRNTPITFLIPREGPGFDPAVAILNEAKSQKIHTVERSAPLSADLPKILRKCMASGHWLIIHECCQETYWSKEIMKEIFTLCSTLNDKDPSWSDDSDSESIKEAVGESSSSSVVVEKSDDEVLDSVRSNRSSESVSVEDLRTPLPSVHQAFRLWLLLKHDSNSHSKTTFPEVFARKGIIVNLSFPNVTYTLMKHNYELMSQAAETSPDHCEMRDDEEKEMVGQRFKLQLSLLHTILANSDATSHRPSSSDVIDTYRLYNDFSNTVGVESKLALVEELMKIPSLGERHLKVLQTVIEDCSALNLGNLQQNKSKIPIVEEFERMFSSSKAWNRCVKVAPKTSKKEITLLASAEECFQDNVTSQILEKVSATFNYMTSCAVDDTSTINESLLLANETLVGKRLDDLCHQVNALDALKVEGLQASEKGGPVCNFFYSEYLRLATVTKLLQNDVRNCISAIKGNIEMNSSILDTLENLEDNKLPKIWTRLHPEIFYFFQDFTVTGFVKHLRLIIPTIVTYREKFSNSFHTKQSFSEVDAQRRSSKVQTFPCYNLAFFLRPDMFLKSLLAEFKMPIFRVEVLPKLQPLIPSNSEIVDSIIVDGIRLKGAVFDPKSQTLQEYSSEYSKSFPPIRLRPVAGESESLCDFRENTFTCPLFHHSPDEEDVLLSIPIPCKDQKKSLQSNSVFASLSM